VLGVGLKRSLPSTDVTKWTRNDISAAVQLILHVERWAPAVSVRLLKSHRAVVYEAKCFVCDYFMQCSNLLLSEFMGITEKTS
jgi:hypothetical protein